MEADLDFEKVVELHYACLYRFAFSLARNGDDACDLTQQTFYIWAGKGHQIVDERKVKSWLFTTLHREFLKRRRKTIRLAEVEMDPAREELADTTPFPFARIDRPAILEALARVDEQYQAAVVLFYLEDYSYPEIAGILDVPLGTVKSRMARGIAQLQQLLSKREGVAARKERHDQG
jgi:RNA polymerase sigma-70 factor, ECF subfamily